ncbi:MAG: hypothetical protein KDB73_15055 [Planctomycetes bacterium]|nr:hypothetical protein [Planctomycetota bacterium]
MRLPLATLLLTVAVASTLVVRAHAEPDTAAAMAVRIAGAVDAPSSMTNEQLRATCSNELELVTYTIRGEQHQATCVPLALLVAKARPKLPEGRNHPDLAFVVAVRARDGYTAAFSFGELDGKLGDAKVYVALDFDGKPLSHKHAPAELIVTSDKKGSRGVRAIETIEVIDLTAKERAERTR